MRILGIKPLTDEEHEALERPVATDRWYDRHTRCWVVMSLNHEGSQIGDATYVHAKADAIRDENFRKQDIAAAAAKMKKES